MVGQAIWLAHYKQKVDELPIGLCVAQQLKFEHNSAERGVYSQRWLG